MAVDFDYIHSIPGRLRVKVPELKRSPEVATLVERRLSGLEAVREVRANPLTGNVLVLYEPGRTGPDQIVQAICELGYLRGLCSGRAAEPPRAGGSLSDALSSAAAELLFGVIFGPVVGGVLVGLLAGMGSVGARDRPAGRALGVSGALPLGGQRAVA